MDPKDKGYSRLYIRLSESPAGERIPAKVIGYDPTFDLALIKTEINPPFIFGGYGGEQCPPVTGYSPSAPLRGSRRPSPRASFQQWDGISCRWATSCRSTSPSTPATAADPLLNEKGDLIGVGFAGLEQFQGLNFAVPYHWIEKILPSLYKGGEVVHPWLGMALAETSKGLEVVYCVPDEPAAKAGILLGGHHRVH